MNVVSRPPPRARPRRYWKYQATPVDLSTLVQEREMRGNGRVIDAACQGHGSLVRRLQCEATLEGHTGCVNTLQWNATGTLLASGSDDRKVLIWSYAQHKQLLQIETGHQLNIFAVCFVPGTDDHVIATGAMDQDVRIHYAPFHDASSKLFRVHQDRVKDIGSSWAVPKMFWSVAEDGHVYQFDLRALPKFNGWCDTPDMSGVLIELGKDRSGKVLKGMGMAVHPLDPTKVVLACGDFYTRLYDRRMLKVLHQVSSRRDRATSPVEVYAPPHLHLDAFCENKTKRFRDNSHGTSIQFSNDGSEILANYHGDHMYLFKVGSNATVVYSKDNKSQPQIRSPPWLNGAHMDEPTLPFDVHLNEIQKLHARGKKALEKSEYTCALKSFNRAFAARRAAEIPTTQRKELHHDCAKAYLGRKWNADTYLTAVHCKKALEIDPNDREIELTYIQALKAGQRHAHAKWRARRYKEKYPNYEEDVISFFKRNVSSGEDSRTVQHNSRSNRLSSDDGEASNNSEQEASHESTHDDDESDTDLPDDDDDFWDGNLVNSTPVNCNALRRYVGYCNAETDIKEATFFGKNDSYVIAGSDDGRALVWDKKTGELVNALKADANIVNCVQPHPYDACLATSGIENVIRLWSPISATVNAPSEAELEKIMTRNQSRMDDMAVSFEGALHNMVHLVFQSGGDYQAVQECAIS
ncbi:hypothetical protein PsorP6_017974 [Peronosclerospora sorghi]|uniref:Uncharacterized protein n=1 Tax=Peronosclerospora sorghi TaxID=230839 RepID=A0ACC0WDZ6_9STRA|nr:hypothetical protein PsorP6_017974 [Peronosclerospora sorghi]